MTLAELLEHSWYAGEQHAFYELERARTADPERVKQLNKLIKQLEDTRDSVIEHLRCNECQNQDEQPSS